MRVVYHTIDSRRRCITSSCYLYFIRRAVYIGSYASYLLPLLSMTFSPDKLIPVDSGSFLKIRIERVIVDSHETKQVICIAKYYAED